MYMYMRSTYWLVWGVAKAAPLMFEAPLMSKHAWSLVYSINALWVSWSYTLGAEITSDFV